MKKHIQHILILAFVCTTITIAQTPNWKWARSAAGGEYDQSSTITTDASGNVIIAGYFASDFITLGSITLQNAGLGFDDVFIAKYDSSGNLVWAQSFGSTSDDKATAVTTDNAGNIYLTGYFYSPTITIGTYTFTNAGNVGDIFIVKYDSNGNILWATKEGGPGLEIPYAISVDALNNIVLVGRFSSNSITFGTTTLALAGSMDVFVVKYNATGNVLWAQGEGGGSNDEAYAVKVDGSGNIYVAGYFNQNAMFGTIALSTTGISDAFIAKYDSSGTVLWAKKAGGSGDDRTNGLALDEFGNSYVSGFFSNDTIAFGPIQLPNTSTYNSFIAKYDASGNEVWAKGIYGDSKAFAITITPGNVYVCGFFREDSLVYGPSTLFLDGNTDFYLANCDTAGNAGWVVQQTSGGPSSEIPNSITADALGNISISGYFDSDPIEFGPSVLSNTANGFDIFVAKMGAMTTGINDLQNSKAVSIYPNPANDKFVIQSDEQISAIEIYNLAWEMISLKVDFNQQLKQEINVSLFPAGIYFVKVLCNDKLYYKRLIIQRR
ncbi:MAG: T9SS type A sorting domain-containing protein [Bacteroidetes bacterium]|nr:T9SS type A sorting domain-containing protein [Bacteroidota bacterium]